MEDVGRDTYPCQVQPRVKVMRKLDPQLECSAILCVLVNVVGKDKIV